MATHIQADRTPKTQAKHKSEKFIIVSPFIVRVLMLLFVCISLLTRLNPSRRKATGVRGTRVIS